MLERALFFELWRTSREKRLPSVEQQPFLNEGSNDFQTTNAGESGHYSSSVSQLVLHLVPRFGGGIS